MINADANANSLMHDNLFNENVSFANDSFSNDVSFMNDNSFSNDSSLLNNDLLSHSETNATSSRNEIETECMLTTFDNPFDPFEQFTQWFLFDVEKGYYTCARLGRIARLSDQFSQKEENLEVERAIDEIIKYDFLNIYKKVRRKKA